MGSNGQHGFMNVSLQSPNCYIMELFAQEVIRQEVLKNHIDQIAKLHQVVLDGPAIMLSSGISVVVN